MFLQRTEPSVDRWLLTASTEKERVVSILNEKKKEILGARERKRINKINHPI